MTAAFAIALHLETAVLTGRRLHLDAILAGITWRRTGSAEAAMACDVLERREGVALASEMMFDSEPTRVDLQRYGRVDWNREVAPSMVGGQKLGSMRGHPVLKIWQPALLNGLASTASAWVAPRAFFVACGDPDRTIDMLEGAGAIGAKTTTGWGRFTSVELLATDLPFHAAWLSADLSPRRAIPVGAYRNLLQELGRDAGPHRIADETAAAPYDARGRRVACAVRSAGEPMVASSGEISGTQQVDKAA